MSAASPTGASIDARRRDSLAWPVVAAYWLLLAAGLAMYSIVVGGLPSQLMWIGAILGSVTGHGLALRNVRLWFVIAVLCMVTYLGLVTVPGSSDARMFWMVFMPAVLCAYASLADRWSLAACWLPAVTWMLTILDRTHTAHNLDALAIVLLAVLAIAIVVFLRVRETRRVALWQSAGATPLATTPPAAVLTELPGAALGRIGWNIGACAIAAGLTMWLAPQLWRLEQFHHHEQIAAQQHGTGGTGGLPCCQDCLENSSRVSEYLDIGRGHGREPIPGEDCKICSASERYYAGAGNDGYWYGADQGLALGDGALYGRGAGGYGPGYGTNGHSGYGGGYGTGHGDGQGDGGNGNVTAGPTDPSQSDVPNAHSSYAPEPSYTPPTYTPPTTPTSPTYPNYTPPTYTPPTYTPPPPPQHVDVPPPAHPSPPPVTPTPAPQQVNPPPPSPQPQTRPAPPAVASTDLPPPPPPARDLPSSLPHIIVLLLVGALSYQLVTLLLRPLRRMLVVRHLRAPLWPETVDQRVSNAWQLALVGLRDAGYRCDGKESPREFAHRVGIDGLDRCATILERARYGVAIDGEDLADMQTTAGGVYRDARERAGGFARAASQLRWPLT